MKTGNKPTEALSHLALYVVIGLAVVVYALFMLIGYDIPLATDPTFSAPLLTPLLIVFVELTVVAAVVAALWLMVVRRRCMKPQPVTNGIPSRRIVIVMALGTMALMALGFALGSTAPIMANGTRFDDGLWLRVADMFIYAGTALIVVAVAAVAVVKSRRVKEKR